MNQMLVVQQNFCVVSRINNVCTDPSSCMSAFSNILIIVLGTDGVGVLQLSHDFGFAASTEEAYEDRV
jgi:hypothetical protein